MATTNADPASFAPASTGAAPALTYDGRFGELFRLWLKTLALTVLTLGCYRFWGRTRIRKYLWSRVRLADDRFEYDGTGGELFKRFTLTLVVLTPLFFGPGLVKVLGAPAWVTGPVDTAQGVALVILAYVGYYAGRRYRLSRTLWRGIRGGLGGQPSRYAKEAFLSGLWLVLTLGFYLPWQRVRLWRYEANHTRFGDRSFTFFGNGRKLLRTYLASLATAVGGSIAIAAAIHISGIGRLLVTYATDPFVIAAAAVAALTLLSSVWGFALVLFDAHWMRLQALGTSFGDVRLSAEINAFQLLRLRLGNLLIRVATLGLGWPFVAQRTLRFLCEAVTVHAADSLDELTQHAGAARPPAGGLAQLLDAGGFA